MILLPENRIVVYYFSGTGNTQIIAGKIVESFRCRGFTAELISIEHIEEITIHKDDVIGLGFPVAGFTTYPIVFDFLKRIKTVQGNGVFAFDTMGGSSLFGIMGKLKSILDAKGFTTLGFHEFKMPLNIFFEFPEGLRKRRIAQSFILAEEFVDRLIAGSLRWKKIPIVSSVMSFLSYTLFQITEYRWHQRFLKMKVDVALCNACGICAKKCPVKNISIHEKAIIEDHCLYCFRCSGICPSQAISGIITPRSFHYLAEGAKF